MTERSEKKSGGRKLLPLIIILITLAVVGLLVVIGFVTGIFGTKFRKDEALNESKYFSYEEAGYSINGDGVIFDRDGIKVTVTGIYHDSGEYYEYDGFPTGNARVGFLVENYYGENIDLRLSCYTINGVTSSGSYIYLTGNFKNNKTVQVYEDIPFCPGKEIAEMVIDEVHIYSMDGHGLGYAFRPVVITTTSNVTLPEYDLSDYSIRYEDENVVIYSRVDNNDYHEGYRIYMENRSDNAFLVSVKELTVDGKRVHEQGIDSSLWLLPGHILLSGQIYSYDAAYTSTSLENREVQLDLSFVFPDDTSLNYDTGYLNLN